MNVALTRARHALYIFGDMKTLKVDLNTIACEHRKTPLLLCWLGADVLTISTFSGQDCQFVIVVREVLFSLLLLRC